MTAPARSPVRPSSTDGDDLEDRAGGVGDGGHAAVGRVRRRLEHLVAARRRLAELPERPGAAQQEVDRLVTPGLPHDVGGQLPKGLSPETTELVQRVLRDAGPDGLSATECAERTGLSRVSARRYLEHFSRTGSAEVSARYGGTGRPERRFRAP